MRYTSYTGEMQVKRMQIKRLLYQILKPLYGQLLKLTMISKTNTVENLQITTSFYVLWT
jgi:hypothetical protein